ncbi:MAG: DUF371 domain-containing protein [Candidatus Hadarchaeum sp.]|uniref:DUF371 domain-containing protein n=1 Tax=Candidatus Hadarchaeum sp. TaxID=2883567 RepID=UPI003D13808C
MRWVIRARGHPMVSAKHRTTFMITKEKDLGPKGDCVIGVGAEKSAAELDLELKRLAALAVPIVIRLRAGGFVDEVRAWGHPSLTLNHPTDIVVRKSRFICGRTLAVGADKAAADLSRELVAALRKPTTRLEMEVIFGVNRE